MALDPGWISAVGGIVQAVGTVGVFGTGGYLLIREIRRDELRRVDSIRWQASRVYGWTESFDARIPDLALQYQWVDFSGPPRRSGNESELEFTEEMISHNSWKPRHGEAATTSTCFQLVVSNDSAAPSMIYLSSNLDYWLVQTLHRSIASAMKVDISTT